MDLAEIQKNAKNENPPRAGAVVAAVAPRPGASAQGEPPEFSLEDLAVPAPRSAAQAGNSPDPLEALFAGKPGLDLATEEGYLKGLEGPREPEEQKRQWLTFSLGKEAYALDIESIQEIIKPREITDIPRVPDFILGIISLRGIIVPVYDLTRRLNLGAAELSPNTRIIVCQKAHLTAGLLVDSINQVVRMGDEAIEPPPGILAGIERDLILGVGRQAGKMMILLNLHNVLDPELI